MSVQSRLTPAYTLAGRRLGLALIDSPADPCPSGVVVRSVSDTTAAIRLRCTVDEVHELIDAGELIAEQDRLTSTVHANERAVIWWVDAASLRDLEARILATSSFEPDPDEDVEEPPQPTVLYGLLTFSDAAEISRRRKLLPNDHPFSVDTAADPLAIAN